ncbi:MAG: hypothetical protein QW707_02050 [Candidatus Bathyarchaeia archaeon]
MKRKVRVTLTFPKELWDEVKRTVPAGERSRLIAEATAQLLAARKRAQGVRRLKVLQRALRRKYGELPSFAEEIQAMREERDARLTGLR